VPSRLFRTAMRPVVPALGKANNGEGPEEVIRPGETGEAGPASGGPPGRAGPATRNALSKMQGSSAFVQRD